METEEAVNILLTVMNDCYDAAETINNGERVEWDAHSFQAMGHLIEKVLEKYFYYDFK